MDFTEAVRYIESLSIQGWRLGNARFEAFLARLGNPHLKYPCVHITGTNGKGSTTALLSSILRAAGFRVGTYSSPHVFDIRERILIDGELIPEDLFVEGVASMRPLIERLRDTEHGQLTEFEMKTALAFWAFEQAGVDIAVVEVGLGGRMDATNVIVPEVSLIVSIGLDHTDRLGATHRDIAYEKAGIIKSGRPVVSGASPPDAVAMIQRVAQAQGAPLYHVRRADIPVCATQGVSEGAGIAACATFVYTALPSPTDSAVRVCRGEWEIALQPSL
ncbi:MAG: bifunctional folylpolyglutamate synthase/dihydrofolate synthase, partial [Fimbriimonadales bacterium]